MIAATDIDRIIGSDAVDQDNDKIGKVSQVYLDSDSERPTWATLKTGLFGTSETLVPLDDASWDDGTLHLAIDKARVKNAPRVDPDAEISVDAQKELYAYYGFAAEHRGNDGRGTNDGRTPTPAPTPTPTPTDIDRNNGRSTDTPTGTSTSTSTDRDRSASSTAPQGEAAQGSGRSSGGAHPVTAGSAPQSSTPADARSDFDDADSLSYSRSDSNSSDLDAGVDSKGDSDDGPRTGVVGTAADRTLGGDRERDSNDSGATSTQQQGEVRLRRYIVVEETILPPRDGSSGDAG